MSEQDTVTAFLADCLGEYAPFLPVMAIERAKGLAFRLEQAAAARAEAWEMVNRIGAERFPLADPRRVYTADELAEGDRQWRTP